jgi:hypothetical protein
MSYHRQERIEIRLRKPLFQTFRPSIPVTYRHKKPACFPAELVPALERALAAGIRISGFVGGD